MWLSLKWWPLEFQVSRKSSCKQPRCDLSFNHNDGDLFTCEDNMLFLRGKIWSFRAKARLVFHCCLYNKENCYILFLSIHISKIIFSRSPVSSDEEAIYVKGDLGYIRVRAYISALLASGFRQNNHAFTPCPLGTFTNPLTKGVDGCQKCPPGNFKLLLWRESREEMQCASNIRGFVFKSVLCFKSAGRKLSFNASMFF